MYIYNSKNHLLDDLDSAIALYLELLVSKHIPPNLSDAVTELSLLIGNEPSLHWDDVGSTLDHKTHQRIVSPIATPIHSKVRLLAIYLCISDKTVDIIFGLVCQIHSQNGKALVDPPRVIHVLGKPSCGVEKFLQLRRRCILCVVGFRGGIREQP